MSRSTAYLHIASRAHGIAIRGNNDIKGIKLPDEPGGKELEAKISMFADDTKLFNKDERSVEKSFDILSKYEKASVQELIIIKQRLFLLALPAVEDQNLIKYHGSKKM